jgi:hypothetical protein
MGTRQIDGTTIEFSDDTKKATIASIKAYFGLNGQGAPISAKEIMTLKKPVSGDPTAGFLPDYDQIAIGLGTGTLTYELTPRQKKQINAERVEAGWKPLSS